jgi:hypothetical protein
MGRPRKEGKCPQHIPNDQKCNGCQRGRGCTGMLPVATELDLASESTSEPPSNDLCHDIGALQHFCNFLIKHVKEHGNANLTTMYAQSDGCKAQFKNTTHYL